jgi:hypothetical protein
VNGFDLGPAALNSCLGQRYRCLGTNVCSLEIQSWMGNWDELFGMSWRPRLFRAKQRTDSKDRNESVEHNRASVTLGALWLIHRTWF